MNISEVSLGMSISVVFLWFITQGLNIKNYSIQNQINLAESYVDVAQVPHGLLFRLISTSIYQQTMERNCDQTTDVNVLFLRLFTPR